MKLWHCKDARSIRPLWTLEELGVDYELQTMPFPPRYHYPGYKELNLLGTVPFFTDGETRMTESSAICFYLIEKYKHSHLGLTPDHHEYGEYLNWLYQSDATLTFPLTIVLRYRELESPGRRLPQAVEDYRVWFLARLKLLNQHMEAREFLCDDRFTIADIAVGYALYFGETLALAVDYAPQTADYLARLKARPAFQRVLAIQTEKEAEAKTASPAS